MAIDVVVPEVGEAGMEVAFVRWLKAEGDLVRAGEPLFELDTAKSILEVEAYASGRLSNLRVQPGDVVEPRQVVAMLVEDGGAGAGDPGSTASVTGSPSAGPADRRSRVRQATAARTTASWQATPHAWLRLSADMTDGLVRSRPMTLICAAIAAALARRPECNLSWIDGDLVPLDGVHLGILVDTPDGLLLPVVRHADQLSLADVEAAIAAAVRRARDGSLTAADAGPRSISISNLGMFSVDQFMGILPPSDVLMLSAGRAATVPMWLADAWQPRKLIELTLAIDHRAIDGADGARLLTTLEQILADPTVLP